MRVLIAGHSLGEIGGVQRVLSAYESVIEEHSASGTTADPITESRAAALFLQELAARDRHRSRTLLTLATASHRILQIPFVGPAATRAMRWLTRRR
jgi:hypothetical protein